MSRADRSDHLTRPTLDADGYRARLGDAAFWRPYVLAALGRHGLPSGTLEVGAVGTFPTFLVGDHVVKLFGEAFDGPLCHATESGVNRLLLEHPAIPAPRLVAEGYLYHDDWRWPYLITRRVAGIAWSAVWLAAEDRLAVARQLGTIVRMVHHLPLPPGGHWQRDRAGESRSRCVERHRAWGTLPAHLLEAVDAYLLDALPERCLVHADLHGDHVFVDGSRLVGIIDWGDAHLADRYYELPALHLGAFGGDRHLLTAFLSGYGWEIGADFARRALSMTLLHEFDVLRGVSEHIDLAAFPTLEALAECLWSVPETA